MQTNSTEVYSAMLKLRNQRKDFVGGVDDLGAFYRNQKLITMILRGDIGVDELDEFMTAGKMSESSVPMDWYHLECYPKPQDIQCQLVTKHLTLASKVSLPRARIGKRKLKKAMYITLLRRIDRYLNPEKYMNNKILCIVGESGAGKTLASLHLGNKLGANVICSYTTRPPRPTEVEGREHHFINIVPDPNELLAYTEFGGYEYYALKTQVHGECTVYVIDEDGLRNLKEEHGDEYRIFSVYITRSWSNRRKTGVKDKRMWRDSARKAFPLETYDWVIDNNSTKKNLFVNIETIYNKIKEMK